MKKTKRKLLHILFKEEVLKVVEKLQTNSGSDSKADVVRDAIKIYEILDQISRDGFLIVTNREGKNRRLVRLPRKKPTIVKEEK